MKFNQRFYKNGYFWSGIIILILSTEIFSERIFSVWWFIDIIFITLGIIDITYSLLNSQRD